jgi:fructosamine-3-kinase
MILNKILEACHLSNCNYSAVNGGDINEAFCISGTVSKYFLKTNNNSSYPGMLAKEANGLDTLRKNCALKIPAVIQTGIVEDIQYILLEWIDNGAPNKIFWEHFGKSLAKMHQKKQPFFGFEEDNYIGNLPQKNNIIRPAIIYGTGYKKRRKMLWLCG